MDWILEHIRLLILIGGALAYWLSQRKKARMEEEEAERRKTMKPVLAPTAQASSEAERVRRIQEDIRRKILERTGGAAARRPVAPPPPPLPASEDPVSVEEVLVDMEEEEATVGKTGIDEALLLRQQELSAKMKELDEARRRALQKTSKTFADRTTATLSEPADKGSILADLRDTDSVRRAIILREVLGTPVGLR